MVFSFRALQIWLFEWEWQPPCLLSGYNHVLKVFSAYGSSHHCSSTFILPALPSNLFGRQLWFFDGTMTQKNLLITYVSRGQQSQKKDKTVKGVKGQQANYSSKYLASSFALKQTPLIPVSLFMEKQNFSSCLSCSGQILRNSFQNCISWSTVPLDTCGARAEAFDTCSAVSFLKSLTFSSRYTKVQLLDLTLSTLQAVQ